jgi:hypothetical protein
VDRITTGYVTEEPPHRKKLQRVSAAVLTSWMDQALAEWRDLPSRENRVLAQKRIEEYYQHQTRVLTERSKARALAEEMHHLQSPFMEEAIQRWQQNPNHENKQEALSQIDRYWSPQIALAADTEASNQLSNQYMTQLAIFLEEAVLRYRNDPSPENRTEVLQELDTHWSHRITLATTPEEADATYAAYQQQLRELGLLYDEVR